MEEIALHMDATILTDDVSDHSDDDSTEDILYRVHTRRCGNTLDYDIYIAHWGYVAYHELLHILVDKVLTREESFRNLVLRLTTGSLYKHMSITRARIAEYSSRIGVEFREALIGIIDAINQGNTSDIYEDYDKNTSMHIYETEDVFLIDTGYFAITRIRSPSGSGIIEYSTLKYLKIINPPPRYGDGNCLFDCISWCLNANICNIDEVRKALKYKSSTKPIKLKHLGRIATILSCRITVYEDKLVSGKVISLSVGHGGKEVKLVLDNRHYSIYDGQRQNEKEDVGITGGRLHIFYDLETYFDAQTHKLVPYAISYYVYETNVIDNCGCIVKTTIKEDISGKIYDVFKDYVELKNTVIIGYNNGAFDDYVLIETLCKYGHRLDKTLIDKHNRILTFKYGYMTSRDLFRMLNTSLYKATKSFGCKSIKGFMDHQIIQEQVDNNTFDEFMTDYVVENVKHYAMNDVVSLKELYFKAMNAFTLIPNMIKPSSCISISQLSYKSYKVYTRNIQGQVLRILPIVSNENDEIIRRALIGGRCDVFERGEFHDIAMVDVCSMYPYVMMEKQYPYHEVDRNTHKTTRFTALKEVGQYIPGYFGVYNVTILDQPIDNIVPYEDTTHCMYDWHSDRVIDRWISNITLEMLIRYKCKIVVNKGYIFDCKKDNNFEGFLSPIMKLKREQDCLKSFESPLYNPALRECLKLIMNSLSGKLCQRPITDVKTLTSSSTGCNAMLDAYSDTIGAVLIQDKLWLMEGTIKQPRVTSPTIIGCLIYDYAKEYMYDNLISKVAHKYYMDTDSMILSQNDLHLIDPLLFGDEAGKLKCSLPVADGPFHCIIGAKKCYCIYTIIDGREVIYKDYFKLKGVNVERDRRIPHGHVHVIQELIRRNDYGRLNEEYKSLETARSIGTIRELASNRVVYILCYQIVRTLTATDGKNNNMGVSNRYIIKRLPFTINDAY